MSSHAGFQPLKEEEESEESFEVDLSDNEESENGSHATDEFQPVESFKDGSVEKSSSIISYLGFWWAQPLISLGFKRPLKEDDLQEVHPAIKAQVSDYYFQQVYDFQHQHQDGKDHTHYQPQTLVSKFFWDLFHLRTNTGSYLSCWFQYVKLFLLKSFILRFIGISMNLVNPLILRNLIISMQRNPGGLEGYMYAVVLFALNVIFAFCMHHHHWVAMKDGLKIKVASILHVYRKLFRLSSAARQSCSTGQLTNLVQLDCQVMLDWLWNPHDIWAAPFMVIGSLAILFYIVGLAAFSAVVLLLIISPINYWITRKNHTAQRKQLEATDQRVDLVNQMLHAIRFIKFYNWEGHFKKIIDASRITEISFYSTLQYLRVKFVFIVNMSPPIFCFAILACYIALGGELTPAVVLPVIAWSTAFRDTITRLPESFRQISRLTLSMKRIQDFMELEEMEPPSQIIDEKNAVRIENATFTWNTELQPVLKNISLEIPHGKLIMVVGSVGSGKSSLVQAILGCMKKLEGKVEICGKISYTSQQPWLLNATFRENITFGKDFEKRKYEQCIDACCLTHDLDIFPAGDMTEIGERGINLSGGQKHRVALARAAYSDSNDIFLFDEPLGAVDPTVANQIFHKCILGLLQHKTRILVTHQIQFLPLSDLLIVMKDGKIEQMGTYAALMNSGMDFTTVVQSHSDKITQYHNPSSSTQSNSIPNTPSSNSSTPSNSNSASPKIGSTNESQGKLTTSEERASGSVGLGIYKYYMQSTDHVSVYTAILVSVLMAQGLKVAGDWWLADWSRKSGDQTAPKYFIVYLVLFVGQCIFGFAREYWITWSVMNTGRNLHRLILKTILRAPITFFDMTPIGRILNRFSKDIKFVDANMCGFLSDTASCGTIVLSTLLLVCILAPYLIVPTLILVITFCFVQTYYIRSSRELKRMEDVTTSPTYHIFTEAVSGVSVLRAFDLQNYFMNTRFIPVIDLNVKAFYWNFAVNRWLGVRLELLGSLVVLMAGVFANFTASEIAGLALTYTLALTANLNWLVRQISALEMAMTSVERIRNYTILESEAAEETDVKPPADWPTQSERHIVMKNMSLRYRKDLDLVLKNINCEIRAKEKIGIVGRTGAGKSSLVSCLFRLVEPEPGSELLIDGINIYDIGLSSLRSKLCIIPQDPMLFHGTLRWNLDPENEHTDFELWSALTDVCMKKKIEHLPGQLDLQVSENGDNFSAGEKQLLCLARAILRRTKILILDEASASLDLETDEIIQKTVRSQFKDCTVLTIAHRVHTIIDSDRVMVLSKGELHEFDTPSNLLKDPNSLFAKLAEGALRANNTMLQ